MKRVYFLLVTVLIVFAGCYEPSYTTSQGVDVFEDCEDVCPDPVAVDHALEYYAMRAPDLLGWNSVRSDLRGVRLFLEKEPVTKFCWQADTCQGTIGLTGIGADVFLHSNSCISKTALYTEITKFLYSLRNLFHDYDYSEKEDYWYPNSKLVEEFLHIVASFDFC